MEKTPYNAKASYNLGGALYKEKNYEEAISAYQNAAKMAQTPIGASQSFHNLGNTYMQSKQYDQAIESYKNALRLNPADEETRYNLAVAKQKKKEQERGPGSKESVFGKGAQERGGHVGSVRQLLIDRAFMVGKTDAFIIIIIIIIIWRILFN